MSAPTREKNFEDTVGAADTADAQDASGLSERELAMLDFERQWWRFAGSKDEAIRAKFDVNATRYFQQLNKLLDTQEALEHDPLLVKRLRRLRDSRQKARAGRSTGMRLD
ncbi:DUF3263 domain-containing protein [Dietzia sp.]|uniref:DUF3263 domain-containing protein n=1 Tax=Dietzia sp. TaxID=1871616 RepID=UPI002FDB17D6